MEGDIDRDGRGEIEVKQEIKRGRGRPGERERDGGEIER